MSTSNEQEPVSAIEAVTESTLGSLVAVAANFYQNYFHEFWAVALLLIGFVLGRFLQKAHPIENYLHKFSSTAKNETQLKTSIIKGRKIRRTIKGVLILAEISLVGLIAFFIYNDNREARFWANRDFRGLFSSVEHGHALLILGVVLGLHFLISFYFRAFENRLIFKLNNISSSKRIYMEKMLSLFGEDVVAEIQNFLLAPKQAEADRAKSQGATPQGTSAERQQLEDMKKSIEKTRAKLSIKEKILKINEHFINSMIAFEWCADCYNEKVIEEALKKRQEARDAEAKDVAQNSTSKQDKSAKKPLETPKTELKTPNLEPNNTGIPMPENLGQGGATEARDPATSGEQALLGSRCQNNCLLKFHVLCDELGKEMQEAMGAFRTTQMIKK